MTKKIYCSKKCRKNNCTKKCKAREKRLKIFLKS